MDLIYIDEGKVMGKESGRGKECRKKKVLERGRKEEVNKSEQKA
jgi:hypothetical protein